MEIKLAWDDGVGFDRRGTGRREEHHGSRRAYPAAADGDDLWLKPENLQPVGAFKIRGAMHALTRLPDQTRRAGVITHSSGNHGQALAYAGLLLGIPVVVVMPDTAPQVKVESTRRFGAEVILVPAAERESRTSTLGAQRGLRIVPPYDHPDIIAGQGTVGLEIVADLPDVEVVLVPVGGGGLASGLATAVKALTPAVAVKRTATPNVSQPASPASRQGEHCRTRHCALPNVTTSGPSRHTVVPMSGGGRVVDGCRTSHRPFYGNQFGLTFPLFTHYGWRCGCPKSAAPSIRTTRPTTW